MSTKTKITNPLESAQKISQLHVKTKKEQHKLVRSAILVSIEAIFCLGLIALIVAFISNKEKPNMYLLFGGFITVIVSLLIISILLCMRCTERRESKAEDNNQDVTVNVISGNEKYLQYNHIPIVSPDSRFGSQKSYITRSEKSLPPAYYTLSNIDKASITESHGTLGASLGTYGTGTMKTVDSSHMSKEEVKKQYDELMRTPTVEEVRNEYFKFLSHEETFNSLKKSIQDIKSQYENGTLKSSQVDSKSNSIYASNFANSKNENTCSRKIKTEGVVKTVNQLPMHNPIYEANNQHSNINHKTMPIKASIKTIESHNNFFNDNRPKSISNLFFENASNKRRNKKGNGSNKSNKSDQPRPYIENHKHQHVINHHNNKHLHKSAKNITTVHNWDDQNSSTLVSRSSLREHHDRLVNLQASGKS